MKNLSSNTQAIVIYDSYFGNTQQIAKAIGRGLSSEAEVNVIHIKEASLDLLINTDILIIGSPTRGFRPSPDVVEFLKLIPKGSLREVKLGAFDTRIDLDTIKSRVFRFIVDKGGYAAKDIAKKLLKAGGVEPIFTAGFLVTDKEGPLVEGELERAEKWANEFLVPASKQKLMV